MTTMKAVNGAKKKLSDLIDEDRGVAQEEPTSVKAVAPRQLELQTPTIRVMKTIAVTLAAKVGAEQRPRLKLRPKEIRCQTSASLLPKRIRPIIVVARVAKMMMTMTTKAQAKSKQKRKEVFHRRHRKLKIAIPQKMTLDRSLHLSQIPNIKR